MRHVLIVGGGFAGLNLAKGLGNVSGIDVTLIDRTNHHLFQPLLYQVAMAGLSPADIAAPIRSLLSRYRNIRVIEGEVRSIDFGRHVVSTDFGEFSFKEPEPETTPTVSDAQSSGVPSQTVFDYIVLACGARHSYFGHDDWEEFAPGLKTLEQATEIRRRVLSAFEAAERSKSAEERKRLLTFVIVGGGPTGVELAGAIGEMSRFTLAKDFRNIDAKSARVILLESGPRILAMFSETQSARAARDLEHLGVQIWTGSAVTKVDANGVNVGDERIQSATVLWAAGVKASSLGQSAGFEIDRQGRVIVENDLSVKGHPNFFVVGDQACFTHQTGKPLPGTAPVAMQQGQYLARTIRRDTANQPRQPFHFVDKGQMATIGRSRAVVEVGKFKFAGFSAWFVWLVVHIYYLTGFQNRLLVVLQWAWSYLTFRRGARLIVPKEWRFYPSSRPANSQRETDV